MSDPRKRTGVTRAKITKQNSAKNAAKRPRRKAAGATPVPPGLSEAGLEPLPKR